MSQKIIKEFIKWDDDFFNTGHHEIDNQHKSLVTILNALYIASLNNKNNSLSEAFLKSLNETTQYVDYHFSTEEKIMHALNYAGKHAHIKEHRAFEKQIEKSLESFKSTENPNMRFLSRRVMIFLKSWLLNHIAESDKKLVSECAAMIKAKMQNSEVK